MTIERFFVEEKVKELRIKKLLAEELKRTGYSHTEIKRTPLGTRIMIYAMRPGLVIGRSGENIKGLTDSIKEKFKIDNPQLEVKQVEQPDVDAQLQSTRIANLLERGFYFKKVAHRSLDRIMECGARGVEIRISGKVPSERAKTWIFKKGYIRHCGQTVKDEVQIGFCGALLKQGMVGVRVRIMPSTVRFPDEIFMGKAFTELSLDKKEPAAEVKAAAEVKEEQNGDSKAKGA